jgi:hypothetical protein
MASGKPGAVQNERRPVGLNQKGSNQLPHTIDVDVHKVVRQVINLVLRFKAVPDENHAP